MTFQYSAAVRNAKLDAVETATGLTAVLKIFSGAEPADSDFKLQIHAFCLVPDPDKSSGHRVVPIPDEVFAAYLDGLSD